MDKTETWLETPGRQVRLTRDELIANVVSARDSGSTWREIEDRCDYSHSWVMHVYKKAKSKAYPLSKEQRIENRLNGRIKAAVTLLESNGYTVKKP